MLLSSLVGTSAWGSVFGRAGLGGVESQATALEFEAVHLVQSGLGILLGVEVDIAKPTRPLHSLVSDNPGVVETGALLEGFVEQVVVNAPAKVSNEEGGKLVLRCLGLVLLDRCRVLLVSLALLRWLGLGLGLLLILGFRIIRIVRVLFGII